MKTQTLSVVFVLVLGGLAQAQGGFGGGMRGRERIPWYTSIEKVASGDNLNPFESRRLKAMGIEPSEKKFIFVYIRPLTEESEPRVFAGCQDAIEAARGSWAFVKLDFDRENLYQKTWGVKEVPACIGCDLYGNDFVKQGAPSVETIRSIIRTTPEAVAKYDAKLKYDFMKATEASKSDEDKGAKLFVDILLSGKNGYKEIADSQARLADLSDAAFRKGELACAVSPESGMEYYEDLLRIYRQTAPGVRAETIMAALDHARGNVQPAIQRLQKVMKYDSRLLKPELEFAARTLEEISRAGDAKIEGALSGSDKSLARELLRKLAKDYAGTEAGKHAIEASK